MSSKSEELYNEVFYQFIKFIKSKSNIESFENLKVMCDFEIPLRKAIKNSFKGCILEGCYFHYCQAIWKKIKKLNLFKKKFRFNTMLLSFICKSYPFIKNNKRETFFQKITAFCSQLNGNYIKFNNYFCKYWKNRKLFDFTGIENEEIKIRTNNVIERFHKKLNDEIYHYHPKCSFLVNELKRITKDYYEKYILLISNKNKIDKEPFNYLANDIITFIEKFVKVHKENIDIESLIQYLKEDGDYFYKLNISILEKIGLFNDNIIGTIKDIFIENNILKSDRNKDNIDENVQKEDNSDPNSEEELEEISDEENKIEEIKEKNLSSDEYNLILGDDFILNKIEKRKNKKKVKSTESENILDNLEI